MPYSSVCHLIICGRDDVLPTSGRGCDEGQHRWKALCLSLAGVSGTLTHIPGLLKRSVGISLISLEELSHYSFFQLGYSPYVWYIALKMEVVTVSLGTWKVSRKKSGLRRGEDGKGKGFRPQFQSDLISPPKWAALQVSETISDRVTDHKTPLHIRSAWPPACLDMFSPWPSLHSCQCLWFVSVKSSQDNRSLL